MTEINEEILEIHSKNKMKIHSKNKMKDKGIVMEEDRGELDLTKQIEDKDKLIQELRMRVRDMLIISEQHRNILGEEIAKGKKLEKEVEALKTQMSEYMSVRVDGARNNKC